MRARFRRGDYVRIGEHRGHGDRARHVRYPHPHRPGRGDLDRRTAACLAATTKNYSRAVPGTGYVVDTVVTIGYATPWRQVEAMLVEAARRTRRHRARARADGAPDRALGFLRGVPADRLCPAERPAAAFEVLHRLHGNIQDVFNEHGVQIMSPHYMMDPKEPQVVPKENWSRPLRSPARPTWVKRPRRAEARRASCAKPITDGLRGDEEPREDRPTPRAPPPCQQSTSPGCDGSTTRRSTRSPASASIRTGRFCPRSTWAGRISTSSLWIPRRSRARLV